MNPSLPDDLFREILKHVLSQHDLYSLSLSSRFLQAEAEYFLYHHVESSRWARTEELCELVIHRPRLHPLIRSLSITNDGAKLPLTVEYWTCISGLLAHVPHLVSLKIYNGLSMANNNAWILDKCIASLRRVEMDFELDNHFIDFLHRQLNLQQIHWTNSSREDVSPAIIQSLSSLSSHFLPSVTELVTNCSPFALHLVNSCNVTHLWISGNPTREEDGGMQYVSQLTANAARVRSLRLNFSLRKRMCVAILRELVTHTPKLRSIGFLPYFDSSVSLFPKSLLRHDTI